MNLFERVLGLKDAVTQQVPLLPEGYQLREKVSARARNIRIEVRPGAEVVLVIPRRAPRQQALAFLRSREPWIRQKLAELAQREAQNPKPAALRWDGSDRILLRGVEVPLVVTPVSLKRIRVRIEEQQVSLYCPVALRGEHARLAQALRRELQQQAAIEARRYLDAEALRLGVSYARLRINDPRSLWGSCNPSGTICLSWRLLLAPPEVFRYVAIHELCHLVHRDHSARFWGLVEKQCPDFERHKEWLRGLGGGLHHVLV